MQEDNIFFIEDEFMDSDFIIKSRRFHEFLLKNISDNIESGLYGTLEFTFISSTDYVIEGKLPKEGYSKSLQTSLDYFVSEELYEYAAKCKKILDKLNNLQND
jgi:hypothetical protein